VGGRLPAPCPPALVPLPADRRHLEPGLCPPLHRCDTARTILFNWTPSLPYRVAWLQHGPHPLQRGDFIVFSFAGEAQQRYPGLHGQPFFKIVRGLPGDP
jgi:hypothetical protein